MGYFTSVGGMVKALKDMPADRKKFFEDEGVDFDNPSREQDIKEGNDLYIHFDWKMYADDVKPALTELAQYFDGELGCQGEENTDLWELHFKGGKAYIVDIILTKQPPIEIEKHPSWKIIEALKEATGPAAGVGG